MPTFLILSIFFAIIFCSGHYLHFLYDVMRLQGGQRAWRPAGGDLQGAAAEGLPLRQRPQVAGCVHSAAATCWPAAESRESHLRCCCVSAGAKKGDRVSIYMPMVVELVVAMLACARIGAVHSIVVSLAESAVKDHELLRTA